MSFNTFKNNIANILLAYKSDEVICISRCTNTLRKVIHLTILFQAIDKELLDKLGSLILVWQPFEERENFGFKPVKFHLKINRVSHPARVKSLIYIYIYI